MKYFQNITDLEQAKKRYRMLAMELHPDKGGSAIEFQQLLDEYKILLNDFQNRQKKIKSQCSKQSDIMEELSKLAKVLIEKQVQQIYLKKKIENSQSHIEKKVFSEIMCFLDKFIT
jgi:curved DNA-binding protein CbpA